MKINRTPESVELHASKQFTPRIWLKHDKNKDDFDDDKDDADQDKSYVGVADERLTKGLRNPFYSTNGAPACPQDIPIIARYATAIIVLIK